MICTSSVNNWSAYNGACGHCCSLHIHHQSLPKGQYCQRHIGNLISTFGWRMRFSSHWSGARYLMWPIY